MVKTIAYWKCRYRLYRLHSASQYTALGHLHRFQNVGGHLSPVVYSSSPLSYSFRKGQEKKVVLIEAKPNEAVKYTGIRCNQGGPTPKTI
jgi:DNA repair exonuclease SbcCD nuclease subunit